ncbi:MAG: DUF4293 domain-containing protein [Bacteroidota bacterium]
MLQRIQSIFLLLAAVACFGLFGLPIADTETAQAQSALFNDQEYTLFDDPILLALFGLAGAVLLIDIFLFRNRPLQIRLSWLSIALVLGGVGYAFYRLSLDSAQALAGPALGTFLPLVVVIFAFLAKVYIGKDEDLVRSADRLR